MTDEEIKNHPIVNDPSGDKVIRTNLLTDKTYSPYCGDGSRCTMPRTKFNGEQFVCPQCKWTSAFPADFISLYKEQHGL